MKLARLVLILGFGLVVVSTGQANAQERFQSRPNIVLLIADDLGYGELECQGNPQIPTPHINSIAERGIRFTNGYVTAAYCSASRAGMMTGRYQNRFGYEFNPIGEQNEEPTIGLPKSEKTLADHLKKAGYATALIGKWHLGATAKFHPLRRGFDQFFGFLHEGHFYVPPPYQSVTTMLRRRALPSGLQGRWISEDRRTILTTHMGHDEPAYDANNPILRDGQPVVEEEYLTDAFTRESVAFIERNTERPFFLCVAYNAVHSPLQAADPYMHRFENIEDVHRRIFAAMLANLDDSVGAILQKLQDEALLENTIVFFLSDNGGPTRELTSSNRPLRGGKGTVYEGGIRVPFLMQWTSQLPANITYDQPVISLDIFATCQRVVGFSNAQQNTYDGVDLIPYLTGSKSEPPHQSLFWRLNQKAALRHGHWKIVSNRRQAANPWSLFDLDRDVAETNDLADKQPDVLARLVAVWQEFDASMPLSKP